MGCYIIKIEHKGKEYFLEWSEITDAPITYGMEYEEFADYYKNEYGKQSFETNFNDRMERVREKGTSSRMHKSMEDVIENNRAGKNEKYLSLEGIIKKYIIERPKDKDDEIFDKIEKMTEEELECLALVYSASTLYFLDNIPKKLKNKMNKIAADLWKSDYKNSLENCVEEVLKRRKVK